MKVSKNPSRITGLILSDVTATILQQPEVTLYASFGLLDIDGNIIGSTSRSRDWSPKVKEAFTTFVEALEQDELTNIFGEEAPAEVPEATASPKDIPTF